MRGFSTNGAPSSNWFYLSECAVMLRDNATLSGELS